MGWYNNAGMGAGGWIAMILMMGLFWGAVIFVGILLFRGTSNSRSGREGAPTERPTSRDAVDILDERLARGELDLEDYQARKAVLLRTKR